MPRGELSDYDAKREFEITPEPGGGRKPASYGPLSFVVQKHDASRLHYDLRLELDGTYKSWAVPRGPSLDPSEKRLAMMVEDHPLEYGTFEGVIPQGEYGAGEDIVWDNGTYAPDEGEPAVFDREAAQKRLRRDLAAGKISFRLRGQKLKGSWALVKTNQAERSWLLFKHDDELANTETDVLADEGSVLSGITIDELKAGVELPPVTGLLLPNPAEAPKAKAAKPPRSLKPMMAEREDAAVLDRPRFSGDAWLVEPKLDGIRAVATIRDGAATLVSRNGNDLTAAYPAVVAALSRQAADVLVLDGELVAPTPAGVPSFELLQQRMGLIDEGQIAQADAEIPVIYYAFDVLHVDGVDLRQTPLRTRKQVLTRLIDPSAFVQVLAAIDAPPRRVFDSLVAQGFEGVVAKRADGPYRSGKRSADWIKVKAQQTEEFVVGGFRQGNGARRSTFGALLVGQLRADGSLGYMGRVGSGFRDDVLVAMRAQLDELIVDENPFSAEPPDAKLTTYVRPELVVELKYAEVTGAGQLRAPVFLRERTDKGPHDVVAAAQDGGAAPFAASSVPASDAGDASLLAQIEEGRGDTTLTIGVDSLKVTNLDKEMWPASGDLPAVTKRDLLTYFAKMGGVIVPHVANRPLTLTRYPNGVAGKSFYQKQWTQTMPPFVTPVALWTDENSADGDYLLCNNVPTLLWLGQLADLALHVSLARTVPGPEGATASTTFGGSKSQIEKSLLNYPDFLLFDLDPFIPEEGETSVEKNALTRAGFEQTRRAALWLKELLDSAGLRSFVKTSGASGIHVFVPIVRNLTYDVVRAVCNAIAGALVAAHPKQVTTQFDKTKRVGKVYIDVNQNGRIKSLAAIYSPRVNPGAPVSMPLRWDEVAQADPLAYNIWTAPDRVKAVGDVWAGILEAKQDVRSLVDL